MRLTWLLAPLVLVVAAVGMSVRPASAAIITYNYTAVERSGGAGTVTGTFGFDDSAPGTGALFNTGFISGSVAGGGLDGFSFDYSYDGTTDPFTLAATIADGSTGFFQFGMRLTISSQYTSPILDLLDQSFPVVYPAYVLPDHLELSDFKDPGDHAWLQLFKPTDGLGGVPPDGLYGYYELTELSNPVPEPASLLLLGTGLVGFAGRAWRKRRG